MQWIAIDLTTRRAWLMQGETPVEQRRGSTPHDLIGDWDGPQIIAGLPDAPVVKVPCPVLPSGGAFPSVFQDSPPQLLPHAAAIAGFLASHENWDGIICLVGAMVHWVHVSANEIVSFQSSVVPETFAAFAAGVVDPNAFEAGLQAGLDRPERLLSHIASARVSGNEAIGRILGALVGTDLKGARMYWLGQQVAVIGESPIADAYAHALREQSVPVT